MAKYMCGRSNMLKKGLWIPLAGTLFLAGCAQMPTATHPKMESAIPAQASVSHISMTLNSTSLCNAMLGQSQAYLRNTLSANRESAAHCVAKNGQCWNRLAEQMDSQQTAVAGLLAQAHAHDCSEAMTLLGVARPYLQASAAVARSCVVDGVPQCLSGARAAVAKEQRKTLAALLGGRG